VSECQVEGRGIGAYLCGELGVDVVAKKANSEGNQAAIWIDHPDKIRHLRPMSVGHGVPRESTLSCGSCPGEGHPLLDVT
jgi:hypothetical protein